MDSVSPSVADHAIPANSASTSLSPDLQIHQLSGLSIDELWHSADAALSGLDQAEFAQVLLTVGSKYNYGQPPGASATQAQCAAFWRGLQLPDLALAHACALGRDAAWDRFMVLYRDALTQAAIGITGSATLGQELADSLYSEMFGLTEHLGERRSPLAYYSGRGSLKGFLRTSLAQRHVDHHRRTHRESPLPDGDLAAAPMASTPSPEVLAILKDSLSQILAKLDPEEQFLLSAWFLDRRTLLEISRTLRVHEATVSRRISRLTYSLHKKLLAGLQASGMSRAAALEALSTDPRDININLRSLLQSSASRAFTEQERP